jgi:hypothetical protein
MSGKKGRSGRKPAPKTLIDQMLARSEPHLPDIWEGLVDLAKGVKIGTLNEDGEMVNVYSKPPDKEAIAEITSRHFGRPRIELDQRLTSSVDVTLDPSRLLEAMREREQIEAQYRLVSEREPSDPTRQLSHAPDSGTPFCEETISQTAHSATSPTDLVGIPPEDRDTDHNVDGVP